MLLHTPMLKIVPLTVHIPLAEVPAAITPDLIHETAHILDDSLRRDFGIAQPRIAAAGLNPHAGEDGMLGHEDGQIVAPALATLRDEGIHISGPYSADTLFHEDRRQDYDAVIAMYHDQALIPVKTLDFHHGVNVTLGLSYIRTSPDHGTALDQAGKFTASPASLIAAIELAFSMARNRHEQCA
jgi:4-hydroxythreonine-4-phosphate dehydrogenase